MPSRLLLVCALLPLLHGAAPVPRVATIHVDAAKRASYRIPRTIFGSFLEPIGNSVYNGLWAEILQNPSFEENLWNASAVARMIRDEPSLARASQLALPLPWEPLDPGQGNRYEPLFGKAANSWRSLGIFGLEGQTTGVKQEVYLPIHRERRYIASIYAMHLSGPSTLEISIRRRNHADQILARATVEARAADWQKYSFTLEVPEGRLRPLEPADFVIAVAGNERVLVDQASLMPADNMDGLDPEMVDMAKRMKTPLVRFGGNFTSAYHWRDGIGPRDKRVSMLNIAWGIPEYNQFGTDEFLKFCELIGAAPQIALNLGSGTPAEAAEWVRYANQHWENHQGGLMWELGNELWGNWNLGYPALDEIAARTRAFSEAVRQADPHARLIATGQDPDVFEKWNAAQLTNPPDTFQLLSTHFVVGTSDVAGNDRSPDFLAQAAFALPVELGRRLRAMQAQIDEHPGYRSRVHIAFTEWLFICCGEQNADAPRYDNLGGAIDAAGFFNMLMRNADIVPVSDMTGIIEFGGIWKKRGRVYGTPAYYAFRLYSNADAETPVEADTNSGAYDIQNGIRRLPDIADVPYLDVVAALNGKGDALTLFCVNRHLTQDIPARISISGFHPSERATVRTLSANSIYERNTEITPRAITPVESAVAVNGPDIEHTFPHESVTVIEFRAVSRN